ncbi:hypothetical protein B2J93_2136 [Marssonina coronariae]|uniref:Uncharacterized protein n=1 Tax=Diplocarpon coronariae TaxID=2795749 RepID=A0A218Z1U2_9HELO|nr:hypothetical protein B2J93_2136 [Marssonina coronariae]
MSLRMRPKARGVGMQGMAGGIGRATVSLGATARGPASSPLGILQPSGLRNPQVDASRAPRYLLHPFPLVEELSGRVAMSEFPPRSRRVCGRWVPQVLTGKVLRRSCSQGGPVLRCTHLLIRLAVELAEEARRRGALPGGEDLTMSGHRRHRRGRGEDLQLGGAMISPYGSLVALEKA